MVEEHFVIDVLGKGMPFNTECRILRPSDKAERWMHGMGRLEFDAHEKPIKLCGIIKDITERKQIELALTASERLFRAVTDASPLAIHISSGTEEWGEYMNPAFTRILGYTRDDIPSVAAWWSLAYPDESYRSQVKEEWDRGVAHAIKTRSAMEPMESVVTCKDGSKKNITWCFVAVGERDFSYGLDLTDRKQAELRLGHSEERYRTAFQTSIDAININRLSDGVYIDVNKAFLDIVGFSRDEVIGRSSLDLKIWADSADRERMVGLVSRASFCRDMEARFRKKNGEVFWGLMSASLIQVDGIPCVLSITRDISASKAAEQFLTRAAEALRVSEERYRTVFQTSLDPILINRTCDRRLNSISGLIRAIWKTWMRSSSRPSNAAMWRFSSARRMEKCSGGSCRRRSWRSMGFNAC
jgi:PAS domain S-box-containing protein